MSNKVHPHICLLLKNVDHSNRFFQILNNTYLKKYKSSYPCSDINFERTQNWKITRSFCAKILSKIFSIILFVLWQVWNPPLQKVIPTRILRQRVFSIPQKWLETYKTGYPIFINTFLKSEHVVNSKCQHFSSIKLTPLMLAISRQFFFHANYWIPVCSTTTICFW